MPRDASGNCTKPLPSVVTGTTIEASYENTTTDDSYSILTDSLSRSGQGGMQSPLKMVDGTVSSPGSTFTNETSSGLYRAGAFDVRYTLNGQDILRMYDNLTDRSVQVYAPVGIETPLPESQLDFGTAGGLVPEIIHVFNDGVNRYGLGMDGSATCLYAAEGGRISFSHRAPSSSTLTERASIDTNGDFLFGVSSLPSGTTNGIGYQFSQATMRSSQNNTAAVVHYGFFNPNGLVGSIQTSGTSTSYVTTSDPRLKSVLETPEYSEIIATIDTFIAEGALGKFQWLSDVQADPQNAPWVYGFDSHKAYDLTGGLFGAPGQGPREDELYSVYGTDPETGEDLQVTPWGIDQSKAVPHALFAAYYQDKYIKALESRVDDLEQRVAALEGA